MGGKGHGGGRGIGAGECRYPGPRSCTSAPSQEPARNSGRRGICSGAGPAREPEEGQAGPRAWRCRVEHRRRAVQERPPRHAASDARRLDMPHPGAERGKSGPARDCGGLPCRGPPGCPGARAQRRLVPQRGRRARDSRLTCGWSPQRLLILLCIGADAREGGRQPHPQDESERNGMRAMDECEDAGARAAPQPHPQPRLPCLCLPRGLAPPAPAPLFACLARVALSPSSPLPRQREPRRLGGVGRV